MEQVNRVEGRTRGTTFVEGPEEGRELLSLKELLSRIKQCGLLRWYWW